MEDDDHRGALSKDLVSEQLSLRVGVEDLTAVVEQVLSTHTQQPGGLTPTDLQEFIQRITLSLESLVQSQNELLRVLQGISMRGMHGSGF